MLRGTAPGSGEAGQDLESKLQLVLKVNLRCNITANSAVVCCCKLNNTLCDEHLFGQVSTL